MTEQQAYLLKLIKEIDEICRRHDIEYVLSGGTLIGAIRHAGFLPWDDDADLYMTRDNWERFKEACKTELLPNRALESPDINPHFSNTFPRYIATDSTVIHSHQLLCDGKEAVGEVIDILILDPISDDQKIRDEYVHSLMLYSDLRNLAGVYGRRFGVTGYEYLKYLILQKVKGKEWIQRHFENKLASCFSENGKQYAMRWGGNVLLFDRSWFDEIQYRQFEDFEAPCMSGANEYMVYHYGDEWSYLPAHAERESHDAAYLTGVPIDDSLKDYTPSYSKSELTRKMEKRKLKVLLRSSKDLQLNTQLFNAKALKVRLELCSSLDASATHFEEAYRSGDFEFLSTFFADYFDWQFSRGAVGRDDWRGAYRFNHPILVNVDDRILYIAVETLINTERMGKAYRLLEVIAANNRLTEGFSKLRSEILRFRSAVNEFQARHVDICLSQVNELLGHRPRNISYLKLRTTALSADISRSDASRMASLRDCVSYALELYPNDGFFKKYHADLLYADGREDEATELYAGAIEETQNGIVLLDVKQRFGLVPAWQRTMIGDAAEDAADVDDGEALQDDEDAEFAQREDIKEQNYLFNLLCELTALCDKHNVRYVLSSGAAYAFDIQGVLPSLRKDYSILVDSVGYRKIIDEIACELPDNRAIEYIGNNPRAHSLAIHYVGTDSLYMPIKTSPNYLNHGLFVTVMPFGPSQIRGKLPFLLDAWKATCYSYNRKTTAGCVGRFIVGRAFKLISWKRFGNAILDSYLTRSRKAKTYKVSGKKMPREMFSSIQSIDFRGFRFAVPADLDSYLAPIVSSGKIPNLKPMHFRADTIVSTTVDFRDFMEKSGLDDKFFRDCRLSFVRNRESRETAKRFKRAFVEVKRVVAYKAAVLEGNAKMDELVALRSQGRYTDMLEVLSDYRDVMSTFEPNYCTSFNTELHQMFVEALERCEEEEFLQMMQERGLL